MSDKDKITPGPWLAGCSITAKRYPEDPGNFSRITIAQRVNRPADAKAIGAVPDLIEALTGLVEWLDLSGLTKTGDGGVGALAYKGTEYSVVTRAREAIRKAV